MMSMHQKLEEWNDIRDNLDDDGENVMKAEFLGRQMNFALEELRGISFLWAMNECVMCVRLHRCGGLCVGEVL